MAAQLRHVHRTCASRGSSTRRRGSSSSAIAVGIGVLLWLWLKRTRTGMVIRAGVDDRAMVSALGINIQLTFAIAFVVGSALAGLGGVIGGSFASLAPGVDANWLLYSLVVVIIGGMGSLGGAAIGALLLGLTTQLLGGVPAVELHVLLDHLHVRARRGRARGAAARPLREARMSRPRSDARPRRRRRSRSSLAVTAPLLRVDVLGRRAADADALPRDRRGEPDLPLRVRRHGLARAGLDLRDRGLRARQRDDEREHEGPEPRLEPVVGRRSSGSSSPSRWRCSSARSRAGASASTS